MEINEVNVVHLTFQNTVLTIYIACIDNKKVSFFPQSI